MFDSMPSRKYSPSSETLSGTTVTPCSSAYSFDTHAVLSVTMWTAIVGSFSAFFSLPPAETAGLLMWVGRLPLLVSDYTVLSTMTMPSVSGPVWDPTPAPT